MKVEILPLLLHKRDSQALMEKIVNFLVKQRVGEIDMDNKIESIKHLQSNITMLLELHL